MRAESSIL